MIICLWGKTIMSSKVTLKCEECGCGFEKYKSQTKGTKSFCSHKCRADYYRRHLRTDEKSKFLVVLGVEYEADEYKIRMSKKRWL